jgi:hypothetical protein
MMTEEQQLEYIQENYLAIPIKRIAKHIERSQTFVRGRKQHDTKKEIYLIIREKT